MNLYLLRHAEAVAAAASDSARPLTEKGWKQAERVGRFCTERGIAWDVVLTSPFVRAVETAEGVLAKMKGRPAAQIAEWLAAGAQPKTVVSELAGYSRTESLLIVGHEPDLSLLAGHLIGADAEGAIRLRKASLLLLDMDRLGRGGGALQWLMPLKFMG